jgi:hypothetical protein
MTGPEHYKEAEKRAKAAVNELDPQWALLQAHLANAHAALALAAATALPVTRVLLVSEYKAWAAVAAVKTEEDET